MSSEPIDLDAIEDAQRRTFDELARAALAEYGAARLPEFIDALRIKIRRSGVAAGASLERANLEADVIADGVRAAAALIRAKGAALSVIAGGRADRRLPGPDDDDLPPVAA